MNGQVFHKFNPVITAHWEDNLFARRSLGCHIDVMLRFGGSFNNFVNLVDLFCSNGWKHVLDFDYVQSTGALFQCLSICLVISRITSFWLFVLEVLGDGINFLLQLGWDWRRNFFDTSRGRFHAFLEGPFGCQLDLRSKFSCNFSPKGIRFVISV